MGAEGSSATRRITEVGVAVALAAVLSQVRVWRMPMGGSVTLGSVVPIWLVARRHGLATGILAGAVHGAGQLVLSGGGHPAQLLLDYPVAYGALGLAALGPAGLVAGVFLRAALHVVSGLVFFADVPAAAGQGILVYALTYNLSFVVPDAILAGLLMAGILQVRPDLGKAS